MVSQQLTKPRRVELILRQIDSLPTLPAVAARLLSLTADDDSSAKQVTELIETDPSLTAKVLSLCRTADKGVRSDLLSIDRAVVLLGFTAIRNAVLSLKVIEIFGESPTPSGTSDEGLGTREEGIDSSLAPGPSTLAQPVPKLDRRAFWSHSLAVAIAAESIAKAHRDPELPADDAFVCGLLHDIGKLALDHVLPQAYTRVVELAEVNRRNIAEFERAVLGLDHHTAGKRLAEQWELPLRLQDCIWLHGSGYDTLPRLQHGRLVGLIRLADLIVRQCHIGYSGNYLLNENIAELAAKLDLDPQKVREATGNLFETLEERGKALGIHDEPTQELFLESIQQANTALGRVNANLEKRSRAAAAQATVLKTIAQFHADARPGRSVRGVMDSVAASAHSLLGEGHLTLVCPQNGLMSGDEDVGESWIVSHFTTAGVPTHSRDLEPSNEAPDISMLNAEQAPTIDVGALISELQRDGTLLPDAASLNVLPLPCGWGTVALVLHDRDNAPSWDMLSPLAGAWGAAIASASQHDGARRLGEELAEANSALAEAQGRLLESESLARVGEMAAGAAHEMNNPLSVICGRSQLLCMTLPEDSKQLKTAQAIFRESHRLSDLISCLRMFADPPAAKREPTKVAKLLNEVAGRIRTASEKRNSRFEVVLEVDDGITANLDPDQIDRAVTELMFNAVQANPRSRVTVTARTYEAGKWMLIRVDDDGDGMSPHTLQHAMDPFFSAKPAGRQVGMGLPRVQQLMRAHGGSVKLASRENAGTSATLFFPLDSAGESADVAIEEDPQGLQ